MVQTAAFLYVVIVVGVIIFQFCLIAGAPWGRLTQGGRHEGALPVSGRYAAALSVLLLASMGAGIASAAGMRPHWPMWTAYVALAVQTLSTAMNWITPSREERALWGPITTVMLLLAAYAILA
ncbi:hypothetical protein [Saccharospirillum alexandrii]|uniref:hypothetical protein n=1 Tax=Saccharospirillum alexandrii TaxID=2448477 RepID=UPI003735AD24